MPAAELLPASDFHQKLKQAALSITLRGQTILAERFSDCQQMAKLPFPAYLPDLGRDLQTDEFVQALAGARLRFGAPARLARPDVLETLREAFYRQLRLVFTDRCEYAGVGEHPERVAGVAVAVGRQLGLPEALLHELHWGGRLHDVGKVFIQDLAFTLEAQGVAPEIVLPFVRTHAALGELLLESVFPLFPLGMVCAAQHQESVDGSGYPFGLPYEALTIAGQIVNLADAYDATVTRLQWRLAQVCAEVQQVYARAGYPQAPVLQAFLIAAGRGHQAWYGDGGGAG